MPPPHSSLIDSHPTTTTTTTTATTATTATTIPSTSSAVVVASVTPKLSMNKDSSLLLFEEKEESSTHSPLHSSSSVYRYVPASRQPINSPPYCHSHTPHEHEKYEQIVQSSSEKKVTNPHNDTATNYSEYHYHHHPNQQATIQILNENDDPFSSSSVHSHPSSSLSSLSYVSTTSTPATPTTVTTSEMTQLLNQRDTSSQSLIPSSDQVPPSSSTSLIATTASHEEITSAATTPLAPSTASSVLLEKEKSSIATAPATTAAHSRSLRAVLGSASVYICLVLAQLTWSGFHVVGKSAMTYVHPLVLPFLRALGTAPCMFVVGYSQDKNFWKVDRKEWKWVAVAGILVCTCCQNLFNTGLLLTTAADGGLSQPAIPIIATLIAFALKREKPTWNKFIGIACAIAGTALIVVGETQLASEEGDGGASTSRRAIGLLCFLGQSIFFSIYLLVTKGLLERGVNSMALTFYSFLVAIPTNGCIAAFFAHTMDWAHLPYTVFFALIYICLVAGVIGFLCFAYANRHLPASVSSLGIVLQPVFSSFFGWSILGEKLTVWHIFGGLCIIAGVSFVVWSRTREAKAEKLRLSLENIRKQHETHEIEIIQQNVQETSQMLQEKSEETLHHSLNDEEAQQLALNAQAEL